jgi:phosphoribosylglycinamide formyltransferase-1
MFLFFAGRDVVLTMHKIAIFASGTGSNTQNLIDFFRMQQSIKICLVVSNKPEAGVLQIAQNEHIPSMVLEKEKFFRGNAYVDELEQQAVTFIILAGFLWKIPAALIRAYPNKIINIHPALLPSYGGKGMYGNFIHDAVIKAGDKKTGITIHFVDDEYDHGPIIFQASCPVDAHDTAATIAHKIHQLEYDNYPKVVEDVLTNL